MSRPQQFGTHTRGPRTSPSTVASPRAKAALTPEQMVERWNRLPALPDQPADLVEQFLRHAFAVARGNLSQGEDLPERDLESPERRADSPSRT